MSRTRRVITQEEADRYSRRVYQAADAMRRDGHNTIEIMAGMCDPRKMAEFLGGWRYVKLSDRWLFVRP